MHSTKQNTARRDPDECYGTVQRTEHRAENGTQACDVKQLNEERFPLRQGHIIDAVEASLRGYGFAGLSADQPFEIASIDEVCCHQQNETDDKSNHNRG